MKKQTEIFALLIFVFALLMILQLGTGLWLFALRFGSSLAEIRTALAGRSFEGVLESAVPHLAAMGAITFIISHFLPFIPGVSSTSRWFVGLALPVLALLNILSGFLAAFVSPAFVYLKLVSFLGFEIAAFSALGLVFFSAVAKKTGRVT